MSSSERIKLVKNFMKVGGRVVPTGIIYWGTEVAARIAVDRLFSGSAQVALNIINTCAENRACFDAVMEFVPIAVGMLAAAGMNFFIEWRRIVTRRGEVHYRGAARYES